jgi:hypothetical protein
MLRTLIALSLLAAPSTAALAQDKPNPDRITLEQATARAKSIPEVAQANTPPKRVRSVTVIGSQKCPKSTGDEVVVCSRINQGEEYRIPKQFRPGPPPAANNSWVNRAAEIDDVSRKAGGLPDTCSVVGSGGQTGCSQEMLQNYADDKREKQRAQDSIP